MVSGTGIDLVPVSLFRREEQRRAGDDFHDLFTADELAEFRAVKDPVLGYAAGFASKEAVFKAIGTGKIGGMSWHDVQIGREGGRYHVTLGGEAAAAAREAGIGRVHLSLTHAGGQIIAWAIAEGVGQE